LVSNLGTADRGMHSFDQVGLGHQIGGAMHAPPATEDEYDDAPPTITPDDILGKLGFGTLTPSEIEAVETEQKRRIGLADGMARNVDALLLPNTMDQVLIGNARDRIERQRKERERESRQPTENTATGDVLPVPPSLFG